MTAKKPIINRGIILYDDYEFLFNFLSDEELGKTIRLLGKTHNNPTLNPTDNVNINNVYNYIAKRIIDYQSKKGFYTKCGKNGGNPLLINNSNNHVKDNTLKGTVKGGDKTGDKLKEKKRKENKRKKIKEIKEIKEKKEKKKLSEDFFLENKTLEKIKNLGYGEKQIEICLTAFKSYWIDGEGKGTKRSNWQSSFVNWITNNKPWIDRNNEEREIL